VADFSDDVPPYMRFGGRRHTDRLVILDVEELIAALKHRPVACDQILGRDLIAELRHPAVDRHPALSYQPIGFPSRTQALLGKKFVDAHGNSAPDFNGQSKGARSS
jgi:hypothetical protein